MSKLISQGGFVNISINLFIIHLSLIVIISINAELFNSLDDVYVDYL